MIMGTVVLAVLLGFAGIFYYANKTDFQTIYTGVSAEDAAQIIDKLKEQGISYQLAGDGSVIKVPADRIHDARLSLAAAGLPRGGTVGYELFDESDFGTTEFVQKMNYQRALQGELSRTIREIEEVMVTTEANVTNASTVDASGGAKAVACPTCRREFEVSLEFCPHDARRLVPASEIVDTRPKKGAICPHCRRGFEAGMRFCPHDATELVPQAVYAATHGKKGVSRSAGIAGKICPRCSRRHDLSATFCSKDGAELVIIN